MNVFNLLCTCNAQLKWINYNYVDIKLPNNVEFLYKYALKNVKVNSVKLHAINFMDKNVLIVLTNLVMIKCKLYIF